MSSFGSIFTALDESGTRYVVVGGLAVVLHGYARLTTMKRAAGRPKDEEDIAALEAIASRSKP